jgi:hypothetical protein
MNIIREPDGEISIYMMDLFIHWGVSRCNVVSCKSKPTTIVGNAGKDIPILGFCEEHYQLGNKPGGTTYKLEFNHFDAFEEEEEETAWIDIF